MVMFHLAIKNLLGAGLRTWLNVVVLSIAFVTIIGSQGLYNGMNRQALQALQAMQTGGGQFWHPQYDPYDPLTLDKAHGCLSEPLKNAVNRGSAAAVLIAPATIYPQGRIQPVLLKGINPDQQVVDIPTQKLQSIGKERPAVIGTRMAESAKLNKGDFITVRWRDDQGTFDAADFKIVEIMETRVAEVDKGQLWIPLSDLQAMLGAENEATLVILHPDAGKIDSAGEWVWRSVSYLTQDLTKMVQSKTASAAIFYTLLLLMALLAVFDTQVLSIWRRRKEMGTLMALGMTRKQLIALFTLEGALHGFLALILGAIYGIPLLNYFARTGMHLPDYADDVGLAMGTTLYPSYGLKLYLITTILILVSVTIVSYLPTRKISKLKPTDALRGKLS